MRSFGSQNASLYHDFRPLALWAAIASHEKNGPVGACTMKQLISLAVLAAAAAGGWPRSSADDKPAAIYEANKKRGRGINLGNALDAPKEGAWGVTLKADYFKSIKDAGFATVRLPVNWAAHAQAAEPYEIDPTFAQRVDW